MGGNNPYDMYGAQNQYGDRISPSQNTTGGGNWTKWLGPLGMLGGGLQAFFGSRASLQDYTSPGIQTGFNRSDDMYNFQGPFWQKWRALMSNQGSKMAPGFNTLRSGMTADNMSLGRSHHLAQQQLMNILDKNRDIMTNASMQTFMQGQGLAQDYWKSATGFDTQSRLAYQGYGSDIENQKMSWLDNVGSMNWKNFF